VVERFAVCVLSRFPVCSRAFARKLAGFRERGQTALRPASPTRQYILYTIGIKQHRRKTKLSTSSNNYSFHTVTLDATEKRYLAGLFFFRSLGDFNVGYCEQGDEGRYP
jgi:hypothetical protein